MTSMVVNALGSLFAPPQKASKVQTQSTPDDKKVLSQIMSTHSPDANFAVDEKPILSMAKDIISAARPTLPIDSSLDRKLPEDKPQQGITDALAFIIHKIGCELSCNCSGEGDMKAITIAVFKTLVKYSWEDKMVLALSAFAVNYGEFCLLSQLHATNPLANYVVQLKPLPDITEREILIKTLLNVVIDVTNIIIDLNDFPTEHLSRDKSPLSDAWTLVPTAVYWAIKGIVACSTQSIGLMSISHEYTVSIAEARKILTDITQTLQNILVHYKNILNQCREEEEKIKNNLGYFKIRNLLRSTHTNNMEILSELIYTKDELPLFDSVTKKRVSLDVMKSKMVILFISYFDISDEDINEIVLKVGKLQRKYEIVWLPIIGKVDATKEIKDEIHRKASLMSWYSLHYSLTLQSYVTEYIKDNWKLKNKTPLFVVFNEKGNLVRTNAYHLIMIWGSAAYPFDIQTENTLWSKSKWSLDFLLEGVCDKELWVKEGRVIYLYGGDDLDWIRTFSSTVKDVVKGEGIILELIYVGKKHIETIKKENLSNCWDELKKKRFRERLLCLWNSKMQLGKSIENDTTFNQLMNFLGSDGSGQGWSIFGHGSQEMLVLDEKLSVKSLANLKSKKVPFNIKYFISSVGELMNEKEPDKHCRHIYLPSTNGIIQQNMVCADCKRPMEKYIMFKCCVE